MRLYPLLLVLLLPAISGCVYSREIAHIRDDVEDALDADLDRQIVLTIGPRTFNSLGWMARRVPDLRSRMAAEYVSDIKRVKVGVYNVDRRNSDERLRLRQIPRLSESGWDVTVRVEEEEETVWVMTRERFGAIRDLLVVSVQDDEVVIVRLEGRLDDMVARAVADESFIREMIDV